MKNVMKFCAPLALLASGAASAVTIDLFDDPPGGQFVVDSGTNNNGGVFNQVGSFASILGGYRDLFIEKTGGGTGGALTASLSVGDNGAGASSLQWSNATNVKSFASVQWDGNDNSAILDTTVGLGGIDLSGSTAFVYTVLEADANFEFTLGVYTSPTVFTKVKLAGLEVLAGSPEVAVIPFAFFSNPFFCLAGNVVCGFDDASPVNFSSVNALEVTFDSAGLGNIDLQIDSAGTVPEPTSLALIGASLLAVGGVSRRRSKKA